MHLDRSDAASRVSSLQKRCDIENSVFRMSAFVPAATNLSFKRSAPVTGACGQRIESTAFLGAPLSQRARMPVATESGNDGLSRKAKVRMDVTVVVGDNEPIEAAIRRFKKDVTKSGHLFELRRRRYFETATEKRLRKATAAKRKARIARSQSERKKAP